MIKATLTMLVLLAFLTMAVTFNTSEDKHFERLGSYGGSIIKIWPGNHFSFDQYIHTAVHEWGHVVYEGLNKSEVEEWAGFISTEAGGVVTVRDGLESGYPFKDSFTTALDAEEEFAECAAHFWQRNYDQCSPNKMFFILEVWE
jgi:hypothetical protein